MMKFGKKYRVYLDHNATTPLHPEVKKAMLEAAEIFGNPSSLHEFGREAHKLLEDSREAIANFIGAKHEEIVFVGSGSEANNTVVNLLSCPKALSCDIGLFNSRKNQIITSKIEHPCVLESVACAQGRGIEVVYIGVDRYGKVDLNELQRNLSERTAFVSIMMANNEIGTIQDVKKIAELTRKNGILVHTDAVQAVGKIPVDVNELGVDYLSFSAHKIYGPKGVGALYIRKGASFCPFIHGGHQERGRRAGTENTLGIAGFAKAIQMRKLEMFDEAKRLLVLKNKLKDAIKKNIPDVEFNGHPTDCLSGTLNVSFNGAEGESILLYLDLEGIAVSTGSACASGSLDPSHVLLATGISAGEAHGSIRMSLGRDTTGKDIDYVIKVLIKTIEKVRKISSVS